MDDNFERNIELINAQWIDINMIDENTGQIEGVIANHRKVSAKKKLLLKKSIQEDPDMLGYSELWVYPLETRYIAIRGNQRLKVMKKMGFSQAPCKVLPKEMPADKINRIAIKDNGHVGVTDIDPSEILIDQTMIDLLKDWGTNVKLDQVEGEESGEVEFSEILNEQHNYLVLYFDNEVDWLQAQTLFDIKTVKSGSTRNDGLLSKKMEIRGIGRVLRGAEAINKILENK